MDESQSSRHQLVGKHNETQLNSSAGSSNGNAVGFEIVIQGNKHQMGNNGQGNGGFWAHGKPDRLYGRNQSNKGTRRQAGYSIPWNCCIGLMASAVGLILLGTLLAAIILIAGQPSTTRQSTRTTTTTTTSFRTSTMTLITTTISTTNTVITTITTDTTSITSTNTDTTNSIATSDLVMTTATSESSATSPSNSCTGLSWNRTGIRIAGDGSEGSGASQLKEPRCVYVDANETIYICDSGNHRIQRWYKGASSGQTIAGGSSGLGAHQLTYPRGLTFDKNGLMYVADTDNHRIQCYSLTSTLGTTIAGSAGSSGNGNNQLSKPTSVLVDDNFNVYITDRDNSRVRSYSPNATVGTSVFSGSMNKPYGMAFRNNPPTQFFITSFDSKTVQLWTNGGASATVSIGTSPTHYEEPTSVITDPYDNVYVADFKNQGVQMFCNSSWTTRTILGTSVGSTPSLTETPGIAFDENLNLYVTSKTPPGIYKYSRI